MRKKKTKYLTLVFVILSCTMALRGAVKSLNSLKPDRIYGKDFVTVFLMAECVLTGDNPYRSLRSLATDHLGVSLPADWRDDPGVLPPPVGLIFFPIGWMKFRNAAVLWWVADLICLFAAIGLALRTCGFQLSVFQVVLVTAFLIGLPPFHNALYVGQVLILILLLLAGMWAAAKAGRNWLAGILLGFSLLLKFITGPFLFVFVVIKNWRALTSAILVMLLGYGLSMMVVGADTVVDYFTVMLPARGEELLVEPSNMSLAAFIWRIFSGTSTWGSTALSAPAAIYKPEFARPLALMAQFGVVLLSCWLLRHQRHLVKWVGLITCICLLIGPVTRDHYMILAALPAAQIAYGLKVLGFPWQKVGFAIFGGLLLCIPDHRWTELARILSGLPRMATEPFELPFAPALITVLLPVTALLILTYLCYDLRSHQSTSVSLSS